MFGSSHASQTAAHRKSDLRPPREVLPGHWQDAEGKLHYFFSQDRVLMIDGDKLLGDFPLEVVEENFLQLTVTIRLKADDANLRTIRIDFKRKGFMETLTLQGYPINNIMLWVGPEQAP
jgi:hypothetical protein